MRGLCALGIMIYHYLTWTLGVYPSETFMGRLGVYGVSMFYVLSGLALYFVYYDKLEITKKGIATFFKKRILRIFPLLWLVTIIEIILAKGKVADFNNLLLNLSGLFSFIKPDAYIAKGVWSIGNELVFYSLFPFFVFFSRSFKSLMILLTLIIFGLYLYFAFIKIDDHSTFLEQWKNYINPLNQAFLFLGGFFIGLFLHNCKINNSIATMLLLAGLGLFMFFPVKGDTIHLITGVNRLVFTTCCFLICVSFYKMSFVLPKIIHKPLIFLGEISYSLYLLHGIVYAVFTILKKYFFPLPGFAQPILSAISSLLISYFVYHFFEKYFIKAGKAR